jgi:group I intron endonuclease
VIYIYGNLYVITNELNGHKYIGKTYNSLKVRFARHIEDSNDTEQRHRHLYRAFKKYGIHNFNIKLLGIFPSGLLEEKEVEYIAKCKDNGDFLYNETSGGDGSLMVTEKEEKAIIRMYVVGKCSVSEIAKTTWISEKTVAKVLANNYIFPDNLSRFREHTGAFIPVRMIDPKTNEPVKEFNSIKYAGKYLNIDDPSHISKVCKGKRISAYGYKWEYV